MKHPILFTIFLLLLLTPSALALGLSGQQIGTIFFEPGKRITNHYIIGDTTQETRVSISGDLKEYITVSSTQAKEFDLIIQFPDHYIEPGTYYFELMVEEINPSQEQIGSRITVTKNFRVEVFSKEKAILASLSTPNVNRDTPLPLQVNVQSRGYLDIESVRSTIGIFTKTHQKVGEVATEEKSLKALESTTLSATFPTTNHLPGEYYAKALVFYDGQQKETNASFRIGNFDLLLKNYTNKFQPGFAEFKAVVTNNWGSSLHNVYAKLFIQELEIVQTPTIPLEPWAEGELKSIIKIDLPAGTYPAKLQLFFNDENKFVPLTIIVEEPTPEIQKTETELGTWIVVGIIILLILIIIAIALKRKHER